MSYMLIAPRRLPYAMRGGRARGLGVGSTVSGWFDSSGVINFSNPSKGANFNPGDTLQVKGWAMTSTGSIAQVQITVDGNYQPIGNAQLGIQDPQASQFYGPNQTTGFSFTYNTALLPAGTHTIGAIAIDTSGTTAVIQSVAPLTFNVAGNTVLAAQQDAALDAQAFAPAAATAPVAAAPESSFSLSWFTDPTQGLISGVPNYWILGGGLAAWMLLGKRR